MSEPTPPGRCLPGDYTVTALPDGFLLGRAVEQQGPGPWWEYIAIVSDRDDAFAQATRFAQQSRVSAWFFTPPNTFTLISGPSTTDPSP